MLCDLLVTAVGWTAPTAVLNASGDRPVYSARAARFFPDLARLPDDVLVTGGIAGDGGLAELTQHATAIGTEAARRAVRIARARSLACPASAAAAASAAGTVGAAAAASSAQPGPVGISRPPVGAHSQLF